MSLNFFVCICSFVCFQHISGFIIGGLQGNPQLPGKKPIIRGKVDNQDVPYPISASWFKDRFTLKDWNDTLDQFGEIGGDTVILRAPPMEIRSPSSIKTDPAFSWCGLDGTGHGGPHCVADAISDIEKEGLVIDDMATYLYEEDYDESIILCPKFETKIEGSRVYYRLVLPVNSSSIDPCKASKGDHVIVLFTMFSGVDPHDILLQSAQARNMSVFFGLPAVPRLPSGAIYESYLTAYYGFVYRILASHDKKYSNNNENFESPTMELSKPTNDVHIMEKGKTGPHYEASLYDTIQGYYGTDEACLATDLKINGTEKSIYISIYESLGVLLKKVKKRFALSPYIILNKSFGHYSLDEHVQGFEALANTKVVDIIAVQEGRGAGKACYYWDTEEKMQVKDRDPVLYKAIRSIDPNVPVNVTFKKQFTSSVNKMFQALAEKRDSLNPTTPFELWLNVEAFEFLRDDPCFPVDPSGSGMAEILNRADKSRLDWAIANAGFFPQKIISFAWDSDFTCTTKEHPKNMTYQILNNGKPVIANCSFHSSANRSIVVIGYQMTSFKVTYPTREGKYVTVDQNGYYFEMDWGYAHSRPGPMFYTQLWDAWNPIDIPDAGTVRVQDVGTNDTYCIFTYDYS